MFKSSIRVAILLSSLAIFSGAFSVFRFCFESPIFRPFGLQKVVCLHECNGEPEVRWKVNCTLDETARRDVVVYRIKDTTTINRVNATPMDDYWENALGTRTIRFVDFSDEQFLLRIQPIPRGSGRIDARMYRSDYYPMRQLLHERDVCSVEMVCGPFPGWACDAYYALAWRGPEAAGRWLLDTLEEKFTGEPMTPCSEDEMTAMGVIALLSLLMIMIIGVEWFGSLVYHDMLNDMRARKTAVRRKAVSPPLQEPVFSKKDVDVCIAMLDEHLRKAQEEDPPDIQKIESLQKKKGAWVQYKLYFELKGLEKKEATNTGGKAAETANNTNDAPHEEQVRPEKKEEDAPKKVVSFDNNSVTTQD